LLTTLFAINAGAAELLNVGADPGDDPIPAGSRPHPGSHNAMLSPSDEKKAQRLFRAMTQIEEI